LAETEGRIERSRPELRSTQTIEGEDEQSFTYEEASPSNGQTYGLLTHVFIPAASFTAVVSVDLTAVPDSPDASPLDASELLQDLGRLAGQIVAELAACLVSPGDCPSIAELSPLPTIESRATVEDTSCPAGQQRCDDLCVDLTSDAANCGQCGSACGTLTCCFGVCADTETDPANCGTCATACDQGLVCADGACACGAGTLDCDGTCVDLSTDANNCGECGAQCASDTTCADGRCVCLDGSLPCGGTCCGSDQTCQDAICVPICPENQIACGTTCVDPSTDPTNCGGCGISCTPPDCCGGQCTNLSVDPANCGVCGNACDQGGQCDGGYCYQVPE
jgi:hypothetical protein